MDEGVLGKKTHVEQYMYLSWDLLFTNTLYNDVIEFQDVFPESVSCELSKD